MRRIFEGSAYSRAGLSKVRRLFEGGAYVRCGAYSRVALSEVLRLFEGGLIRGAALIRGLRTIYITNGIDCCWKWQSIVNEWETSAAVRLCYIICVLPQLQFFLKNLNALQ